MNVLSRRQVHQRIASPFAAPHSLFHFLFNSGRSGGVSYIRIYLDEEFRTDNHGLGLRMVDVGRQCGTSCCNLIPHKFRCDVSFYAQFLAVHVFANGNVLHFRGDNSFFGIVHLRNLLACFRTVGQGDMLKTERVEALVCQAHLAVFGTDCRQSFHFPLLYPRFAEAGQTFL